MQGFWQRAEDALAYAALTLLDVLVPSAAAVDLTASNPLSTVFFDDTQDEDCSPGWDWSVRAEGGASDTDLNNFYQIRGVGDGLGPCGSDITIIDLQHNGSNGANSS